MFFATKIFVWRIRCKNNRKVGIGLDSYFLGRDYLKLLIVTYHHKIVTKVLTVTAMLEWTYV